MTSNEDSGRRSGPQKRCAFTWSVTSGMLYFNSFGQFGVAQLHGWSNIMIERFEFTTVDVSSALGAHVSHESGEMLYESPVPPCIMKAADAV